MGRGREGVLLRAFFSPLTSGANTELFLPFCNPVFLSLIIVHCFLPEKTYTLLHLPEHAYSLLVVVRDTLLVYNFPCEGCHGNTIYCIPGLICA